jgi:hypothetical protein
MGDHSSSEAAKRRDSEIDKVGDLTAVEYCIEEGEERGIGLSTLEPPVVHASPHMLYGRADAPVPDRMMVYQVVQVRAPLFHNWG